MLNNGSGWDAKANDVFVEIYCLKKRERCRGKTWKTLLSFLCLEAASPLFRVLNSALKMSGLSQVAVYSESSDIYKVSGDNYRLTRFFSLWILVVSNNAKIRRKKEWPECQMKCFLKNVFCNPAFELEGEREDRVEGFRTSSSTPEPIKPSVSCESKDPAAVYCV